MKKLPVFAAAVAFAFAFVVPAHAEVHPADPSKRHSDKDISVTFDLPIQLKVKHACWVEFRGWYGENTQKEGFDLGNISPGSPAFDRGRLLVKSNDDFSRTFGWTNLAWEQEGNEGPYPDLVPIVSIGGQPRTSPFTVTGIPAGEWYEPVRIDVANLPWTTHPGSYLGKLTVSVSQE